MVLSFRNFWRGLKKNFWNALNFYKQVNTTWRLNICKFFWFIWNCHFVISINVLFEGEKNRKPKKERKKNRRGKNLSVFTIWSRPACCMVENYCHPWQKLRTSFMVCQSCGLFHNFSFKSSSHRECPFWMRTYRLILAIWWKLTTRF